MLPEVIKEKINGYVSDLYFREHVEKYSKSLNILVEIRRNYLGYFSMWKIRYDNKTKEYHIKTYVHGEKNEYFSTFARESSKEDTLINPFNKSLIFTRLRIDMGPV